MSASRAFANCIIVGSLAAIIGATLAWGMWGLGVSLVVVGGTWATLGLAAGLLSGMTKS